MHDLPPEPCFSWNDLERWAEEGLLQPDQLMAIRGHVSASTGSAQPVDAAAVRAITSRPARERDGRLSLVTIAYYFGAFLVLLAYTIFLGLQWQELARIEQAAIACGTVAALWAVGGFLRSHSHRLAGNLLIFAGTGITSLAAYTILQLVGLWPSSSEASVYRDFYRTIDVNWVILELTSITVALVVIWWTRFPLLTLLIGFWGWYFSMDITEALTGHDDFAWGPAEWTVGTSVGLTMLGIGVWLQRRRNDQDWSFWFYLFGHVAVLGNLAALALDDGPALGLLFLAVYLGFVVASVWLQARVFLVFGALGCYAYLCKLAFDVFAGSLGFTFGLALVGLLIVLTAVGYQRYLEPWLAGRFARAGATRSMGT